MNPSEVAVLPIIEIYDMDRACIETNKENVATDQRSV